MNSSENNSVAILSRLSFQIDLIDYCHDEQNKHKQNMTMTLMDVYMLFKDLKYYML